MGGRIEIAPPFGPAPACRVTVARIPAACGTLAIEDEFDGKAIRLRLPEHGSAGSMTPREYPRSHDSREADQEGGGDAVTETEGEEAPAPTEGADSMPNTDPDAPDAKWRRRRRRKRASRHRPRRVSSFDASSSDRVRWRLRGLRASDGKPLM